MVAGFSVPAPTSVLNGCTIMQPRSVQYFVSASSASCMVSTTTTSGSVEIPGIGRASLFAAVRPPDRQAITIHHPPDGPADSEPGSTIVMVWRSGRVS